MSNITVFFSSSSIYEVKKIFHGMVNNRKEIRLIQDHIISLFYLFLYLDYDRIPDVCDLTKIHA